MTKQFLNVPEDRLPSTIQDAVKRIQNTNAPVDAIEKLISSNSVDPPPIKPNHVSTAPRLVNGDKIPRRRVLRFVVMASTAAAILVAASFWPSGTANVSANVLVNMQEAMAKAKTTQFAIKLLDSENVALRTTKGFVNAAGIVRQESADSICILDFEKGKTFELQPKKKFAKIYPANLDQEQKFLKAVFNVVRGEHIAGANKIGEQRIDGKLMIEYKVKMSDAVAKILVDTETSLPQKVTIPMHDTGIQLEFSEFIFDEPLDDSLFAFNIPKDFEVQIIEPAIIDGTKLVLEKAVGLGPVKFGFKTGEVIVKLGEPDSISKGKDIGPDEKDVLFYNSHGFQIQVHPELGVDVITCLNASTLLSTKKFLGQYSGGIEIGTPVAKVVEIFGDPDREENECYIYESLDEPFMLCFRVKNGKVNSISVLNVRPHLAEF